MFLVHKNLSWRSGVYWTRSSKCETGRNTKEKFECQLFKVSGRLESLTLAEVSLKKTIAKDGDICSVDGHHGNLWLHKCVQVCPSVLRLPGNSRCVTRQSSGKVHKTPPAPNKAVTFFCETLPSVVLEFCGQPQPEDSPPTAPHPTPPSYLLYQNNPTPESLTCVFMSCFLLLLSRRLRF